MVEDSFKDRYFIKIASSVIIAALNALIQFILPRALSVEEYGFYTYNLNIFTSIVTMATLSAPSALISKFSKRNGEIGLVRFYLKFYLAMAAMLNIAVIAMYQFRFLQETFAGQALSVTVLGLESALFMRLLTDNISMFDALAISRYPAVMQIILKVVMCAAVAAGYFMGRVSLAAFYAMQVFITGAVAARMLPALFQEQGRRFPDRLDYGTRHYFKEYAAYCRPLILSSVVSQAVAIFMNWALMNWAGAAQQAMFGVAWQLNSLVGYVFSPYAELSKREFAVIAGDKEGLTARYRQALKIVMWMTCYFAMFIGFESDWMIRGIYGDRYVDASFATLLVMYYTAYQSWGQVTGAFLMAVEKTKVSAVVGVVSQFLTLACAILFQVPNAVFQKGLGAEGIALTYLVPNIASVGITMFAIARMLGTPFLGDFRLQALPIALCSLVAYTARWPAGYFIHGESAIRCMLKVGISGIAYTMVIFGLLYARPEWIGLTQGAIRGIFTHAGWRK